MLTLDSERLIEILGAEILTGRGELMVNGIATDSRRVEPGNAFVAFSGERVDGHEYLVAAMERGARTLIVTESADALLSQLATARERDVMVVRVADALGAVQALASYHRSRLFCPVVGVTGSTGKTTTKDFIASVVSQGFRVIATEGNQNNELGVPLTILRAGADTDVLVVEMAMRGAGQIAHLASIARPTAGLITNVGTSHIELLGTQKAIADAKGELVSAVASEGCVFLNGDDIFSGALADKASAEIITYGMSDECVIRALDVMTDEASLPSFTLVCPAGTRKVTLAIPGRHNVYNALAATAVALYLEIPLDDIVDGLEAAESGQMRMQSFETASGVHVINDAYNANPTSMRAAIETLSDMSGASKRIAVLGDMAELGSLTELAHFRIGEEVARLEIDALVTVGERARRIADGARAEGMPDEVIRPCQTPEEATEVLDDLLAAGDAVLVKASRVMGLERIVEGIVDPRV
ncbi:MAG: UDP-N-acetylmuramoyl-tripeptide--D-alanyl-D-alanine ligase [Actinobacteria bacterium]|nr:UDP-N-acetylmuramoyl-tripeptide--D-alanyl-D-alanine ligase [Actinomycetota bacterium]